jgi:hypothetical protein
MCKKLYRYDSENGFVSGVDRKYKKTGLVMVIRWMDGFAYKNTGIRKGLFVILYSPIMNLFSTRFSHKVYA